MNRVALAACFNPPKVARKCMIFVFERVLVGVAIRPCRRNKVRFARRFPHLKKATHAHGFVVGLVGRDTFVKLRFPLAPDSELSTSGRCQYGIPRTIRKHRCRNLVEGFGVGLPSNHLLKASFLGPCVKASGVQ
ncbi:hypothetical protein SDC9_198760 [bioreactor metagenome]|uniref:Uncharacterized protein n=1 Tax=bioreactor metagenome TaxID=1076179 RepID=A0A645IIJ4_9ZZZZ